MKSLKPRTSIEGTAHHASLPIRVYEWDDVHKERIARSREYLHRAISTFPMTRWPLLITELCCGTADISGHEATTHNIMGYDCNRESLKKALERFPNGLFQHANVEEVEPHSSSILVLCEALEHISDPETLARKWLSRSFAAIISHPIDGDVGGDLSGGDHQWSFSEDDLKHWPSLGGHKLVSHEIFPLGGYRIGIVYSLLS